MHTISNSCTEPEQHNFGICGRATWVSAAERHPSHPPVKPANTTAPAERVQELHEPHPPTHPTLNHPTPLPLPLQKHVQELQGGGGDIQHHPQKDNNPTHPYPLPLLQNAFKNYMRTRDYSTTSRHIIHMCLRWVRGCNTGGGRVGTCGEVRSRWGRGSWVLCAGPGRVGLGNELRRRAGGGLKGYTRAGQWTSGCVGFAGCFQCC